MKKKEVKEVKVKKDKDNTFTISFTPSEGLVMPTAIKICFGEEKKKEK